MTQSIQSSVYSYTANVIAYNATTKVATLDTPINISLGTNSGITGDGSSVDVSSQYTISGTFTNIANAIVGGGLPKMSTDEGGNFAGIFNVPSTSFHTGSRVFRLDNRTISNDPTTATTFAQATFTAGGLSSASQQLDFAPSVDSSSATFTQISQIAASTVSGSALNTFSPLDPVAQTFIVSNDAYPNGLFLYSVKLFFGAIPSTNAPITVSIIPTINGYPNGQALSYSTVSLNPSQVNVSSNPHFLDPTTYTEFQFNAPVYIQPGVLYAFMVQSSSPDYELYYAQQNQIALPSTARANPSDPISSTPSKINAAPYVGALFESQNSITWTADQTKDLMFVIDQCVFETGTATVPFVVPANLPYRKLGTNDITHKYNPNSVSNLRGNYSPAAKIDAINVSTTDFGPGSTDIAYQYQATLANGNIPTALATINPGEYGTPTSDHVYLNDGKGERALLRASNSSFSLFATLSSTDPNVSPIISDDGVSLYTIRYIINNMGIGNNVISIANGGWGYNIADPSFAVSITNPDTGSNLPVFGVSANSNGSITSVYVNSPGSGYLTTPTITIYDSTTRSGNANAVISVTGETSPKGGNSYAKYYTKKVVLAPGNDSQDLRVYHTSYVPLGTAVYVYYKILSSQDTSTFESGNWQLMTTVSGSNNYSTSRSDLIDFECAPGIFSSGQANNNISYTNANGQGFNSFIQFAIKIVLATSDNTNVPFVTSLQALALPSGTGI